MFRNILRILLALVFLVSGFVKAVDVVGFSFKMEEYFSPSVFNIPFLEQQSLLLAILVVVIELVFGFLLLIKTKLKFTLSILITLCVFFAFLTFYSAYFNVVTDCGCFGDALKMEPWQSFWKDIILLTVLLITYFLYRNNFEAYGKSSYRKYIGLLALLVMIFVISWGIRHEPLIDFRDYKIGTDLNVEKQKIEKNPSEFKTFYTLINSKTGENTEVNQDDYVNDKKYWDENSPWKIVEGKTTSKLVKQGYESEISKFNPETSEGQELTTSILNAPKALLLFSYRPNDADTAVLAETEELLHRQKDALVVGISTQPNTFKMLENALMDGTAIKTIARSNPFVLTLKNGKIVDKCAAEDYIKKNK